MPVYTTRNTTLQKNNSFKKKTPLTKYSYSHAVPPGKLAAAEFYTGETSADQRRSGEARGLLFFFCRRSNPFPLDDRHYYHTFSDDSLHTVVDPLLSVIIVSRPFLYTFHT
jgi:hypothetical protein